VGKLTSTQSFSGLGGFLFKQFAFLLNKDKIEPMKVILLQDIPKVGKKFEIKNVSNGFAINLLLPQKLARLATNQIIKEMETEKKKYEDEQEKGVGGLKEIIEKLAEPIEIKAKTNEEGKLFAGIDKNKIVEAIQQKTGAKINADIIELDKPIKEVGKHNIGIKIGDEKNKITLVIKGEEK